MGHAIWGLVDARCARKIIRREEIVRPPPHGGVATLGRPTYDTAHHATPQRDITPHDTAGLERRHARDARDSRRPRAARERGWRDETAHCVAVVIQRIKTCSRYHALLVASLLVSPLAG